MDGDVVSAHKPKRSFGKHPKIVESPAYDASEEDNDPLSGDDAHSKSTTRLGARSHPKQPAQRSARHQLASSLLSDSDGVDSPTYDGDIESSATAGPDHRELSSAGGVGGVRPTHHHHASSTSTFDSRVAASPTPVSTPGDIPVPRSASMGTVGAGTSTARKDSIFLSAAPLQATQEPAPADISMAAFNPASLTPLDIQAFVQKAIDGEDWRTYKINPPPTDRPARVYADGVYDLFHFGCVSVSISFPPLALGASHTRPAAFMHACLFNSTPIGVAPPFQSNWRGFPIPLPSPLVPHSNLAFHTYIQLTHALQLRQAKLSFPSVYLLVGVNSDEQVIEHKARGVMTHAERLEGGLCRRTTAVRGVCVEGFHMLLFASCSRRPACSLFPPLPLLPPSYPPHNCLLPLSNGSNSLESVRHCRWVDEIVADAPWVITQSFIDKYQIDYVAHDEEPYAASGHDDVYGFVKGLGKFIPTRRTPGVSTSELLERIVSGYRQRAFDAKLVKMGHAELRAEGSDYDDSRAGSRVPSRVASPGPSGPRLGVC
ncbi:Cholinephosphate cytidylyltransferase [Mycena sanguinolenta]|uniref:choline-phosphate cytidylyltransferase n=1 Tax=Mycena sanguinolenta TaxID=230812 RepID=A0A8H7DFF2_9AGAR|nr:Cholinephosphate cytidylyltransferase [Mycena sanguinolenta]